MVLTRKKRGVEYATVGRKQKEMSLLKENKTSKQTKEYDSRKRSSEKKESFFCGKSELDKQGETKYSQWPCDKKVS